MNSILENMAGVLHFSTDNAVKACKWLTNALPKKTMEGRRYILCTFFKK